MLQSETGALTNQLCVSSQQPGQGTVRAELQQEREWRSFGFGQCVVFAGCGYMIFLYRSWTPLDIPLVNCNDVCGACTFLCVVAELHDVWVYHCVCGIALL